MKRVLLIEDDPLICDLIVDCFGDQFGAEVLCPRRGLMGARMMVRSHFDLAIIDVGLPEISGVELATFAANENIPVLLISGHPEINNKLERFDYPYLAKPFGLDQLAAEAVRVIAATGENIRRVKASAEKMRANKEALSAAVAESQRLLQEIKTQHAARKLVSRPMQMPSAGWIDDLN